MHSEKAFPCPETGGESLARAGAGLPRPRIAFGASFLFIATSTWSGGSRSLKQSPNLTAFRDRKSGSLSIADRSIFLFALTSWELEMLILVPGPGRRRRLLPALRKALAAFYITLPAELTPIAGTEALAV